MTIGTPVNFGNATGATSATSAAYTPTALARLFAVVGSRRNSGGDPTVLSISDSDGLSSGAGDWIELGPAGGTTQSTGGAGVLRLQLFTRLASSSPASLTISTSTSTGSLQISILGTAISGGSTDLSNIKIDPNIAGDPAPTLNSTPVSTSTVIGWCCSYGVAALTIPTNYTQVVSYSAGGNVRTTLAYDAGSAAAAAAWSSTNTATIAIGLEIKEPASGVLDATLAGPATTVTGALTGAGALAATLTGPATTVSGALTGAGALAATLTGPATVISGTLKGAAALAASLVGPATVVTGALTGAGVLSATLTPPGTVVSATAFLPGLQALLVGPATIVTGTLTGAGALAVSLAGPATVVTGAIAGTGALAAIMALPGTVVISTLKGAGGLVASLALPGTVVSAAISGGTPITPSAGITMRGLVCNVGRLMGMGGGMVAPAAFVGPLDSYTANLAGVWDYRRMLASWTGPLIRVQRTDTTQQDIGATSAGALDEVALLAFVSSGNGYVVKRYDQSGNGRDMVGFGTVGGGPRIVLAGVVDKLNGKPCGILASGSNEYEQTADFTAYTGTNLAAVWAGQLATHSTNDRLFGLTIGTQLDWSASTRAALITTPAGGSSPTLHTYRNTALFSGIAYVAPGTVGAVSVRFDGTNVTMRTAPGTTGTGASSDAWNFSRIVIGSNVNTGECLDQNALAGTQIVWFGDPGATAVEAVRAAAQAYWS